MCKATLLGKPHNWEEGGEGEADRDSSQDCTPRAT